MSMRTIVGLGTTFLLSQSYSAAPETLDILSLVEGPNVARDLQTLHQQKDQTHSLSSSPLSTLLFSANKAYQRQGGAYIVTTEGIATGLEWSPRGETLQVVSIHQKKDGNKTLGYAEINYYGRDEKKVTSHFISPTVELKSSLIERKFSDYLTQATLLSGNIGLVEFTIRKPSNNDRYPRLTDEGLSVVSKIDTKSGRTLASWELSEGDQLLVDKKQQPSKDRNAYIFHREENSEGNFACALYDVLTGQKIALKNNTGVVGILPDGSILFNQPSETSKGSREKVVYKDGVLATYIPSEVITLDKPGDKPEFELSTNSGNAILKSNTSSSNTSLPSKLNLGLVDTGALSPIDPKATSITVALLNSGILAIKTITQVDLQAATKSYEDAVEMDQSGKKAEVIADALEKLSDSGTDLSKMSDQQIKDLIRGSADLSSLGGNTDLFKGQFEISREGSDVTISFKSSNGYTFKVVPGGYEIIPPTELFF